MLHCDFLMSIVVIDVIQLPTNGTKISARMLHNLNYEWRGALWSICGSENSTSLKMFASSPPLTGRLQQAKKNHLFQRVSGMLTFADSVTSVYYTKKLDTHQLELVLGPQSIPKARASMRRLAQAPSSRLA